jgi:hypothetical protein
MATIVWAKKEFRRYVLRRGFKIVTGDKTLNWVSIVKNPSSSLLKWFRKMEGRDFRYIIAQVELFYMQILSPVYSTVWGKVGRYQ